VELQYIGCVYRNYSVYFSYLVSAAGWVFYDVFCVVERRAMIEFSEISNFADAICRTNVDPLT
jgi:hypothetical protein